MKKFRQNTHDHVYFKMLCGTSGFHSLFLGSHPTNTSKTQWLAEYSKIFKSVELSYIYKDLTPKICKKWTDTVGKDFKFTIVYKEKLKNLKEWWKEFEPCVATLGNNFECILFKFGFEFKKTTKNMSKIKKIKKSIPTNIKCAFEFHNLEWYIPCETTKMLFSGQNWAQVILVSKSDSNIGVKNPDFVYIKCLCAGNYESSFLKTLLSVGRDISADEKIIIYFDSLIETWTLAPDDLDVPCDSGAVLSIICNAAMVNTLV